MPQSIYKINTDSNVFIIGCGSIGQRVAKILIDRGVKIKALTRSDEAADSVANLGITPISGDLDDPASLVSLNLDGHLVFYFAPPPRSGITDQRLTNFLFAITGQPPQRIVYISTSGVYGDRKGEWVNETAEPQPESDRARRRLDAEQQLRDYAENNETEVVILRVGGIFSPDKLPVERIRKGTPVLNEEECGYINRIHADDLTTICIAAMEKGKDGEIYNVSDGHPGTMTGYYNAVADSLGLARPPALTMEQAIEELTPAMLSYLTESRRLDNSKMVGDLNIELRYPTLESSLVALTKLEE